MQRKSFGATGVDLLDQPGQFRATFARLNVIDLDGDVTLPGAFTDGQEVRIAQWGHNWGALPIGKGTIHADGEKAWVDGQLFLDTQAGAESYKVIKGLGGLQEWSYGFEVKERSYGDFGDPPQEVQFLRALNVFEVSPVMIGAGIDTGTDAIKGAGAKGAVPYKKTDTSDAGWDGPAAWRALPSAEGPLRAATAWVDPEGNPDAKTSYKFIHHEVSSDGSVGAANLTACSLAIGSLNGARGGAKIPDADRQAVYDHLAHHLRDAGKEPPELAKAAHDHGSKSGLTLVDQSQAVLAAADDWIGRVASLAEVRAKEGRMLSAANVERLMQHVEMHRRMAADLQGMIDANDPKAGGEGKRASDVQTQFLIFQRTLARLNGAAV